MLFLLLMALVRMLFELIPVDYYGSLCATEAVINLYFKYSGVLRFCCCVCHCVCSFRTATTASWGTSTPISHRQINFHNGPRFWGRFVTQIHTIVLLMYVPYDKLPYSFYRCNGYGVNQSAFHDTLVQDHGKLRCYWW